MKKNETVQLEITSFNSDGAGVGRVNGEVVFVPYALPGETVEALIIKAAKNYSVGKLQRVIVISNDRVEPKCPYFYRCGGCDYQHIEYSAQLNEKCQAALSNINKLSGLNIGINEIIPAEPLWRYRTKAQFPVGIGKDGECALGFFASHSHTIVPISDCLLQDNAFAGVIEAVKKAVSANKISVYDEEAHKGILRHVVVRKGQNGIMVIFVTNSQKKLPEAFVKGFLFLCPNAETVIQNINTQRGNIILGLKCLTLFGNGYIENTLCGIRFNLRPLAFLQVNPYQTEKLYSVVEKYAALHGNEIVFDAYCGIGVMSLMLAKHCKKLIGVEIVPEAIATAEESARINGFTNAEFTVGACEDILPELICAGEAPDVLVVDPPRAGCEASLISAVADARIPRIVYVSCNPATLARDLKLFASLGYTAEALTFVDMFCQTKHVETVVLLCKK